MAPIRRPDRIKILRDVVDALANEDFETIDLIFGEFGLPVLDVWQGSKHGYVANGVSKSDDKGLLELAEAVGIDVGGLKASAAHTNVFDVWPETTEDGIWQKGFFRIFLSHVSSQKEFAGQMKSRLALRGVDLFVAHEDIMPSKKWLEQIARALKTTDALAALLTEEFRDSQWTDQEVGFALSRQIPIWPLKISQDPHGFLGQHQALVCDLNDPIASADRLYEALLSDTSTSPHLRRALVARLRWSTDFSTSIAIAKQIRHLEGLTSEELSLLAEALEANGQVSGAYGVPKIIAEILKRNGFVEEPPVFDGGEF